MNLKRLLCTCSSCGSYMHPFSLWLSDTKALVVSAHCVNCEKEEHVFFPLDDMFKACPLPDFKAIEAPRIGTITVDDVDFLHAMHITCENKEEDDGA